MRIALFHVTVKMTLISLPRTSIPRRSAPYNTMVKYAIKKPWNVAEALLHKSMRHYFAELFPGSIILRLIHCIRSVAKKERDVWENGGGGVGRRHRAKQETGRGKEADCIRDTGHYGFRRMRMGASRSSSSSRRVFRNWPSLQSHSINCHVRHFVAGLRSSPEANGRRVICPLLRSLMAPLSRFHCFGRQGSSGARLPNTNRRCWQRRWRWRLDNQFTRHAILSCLHRNHIDFGFISILCFVS